MVSTDKPIVQIKQGSYLSGMILSWTLLYGMTLGINGCYNNVLKYINVPTNRFEHLPLEIAKYIMYEF